MHFGVEIRDAEIVGSRELAGIIRQCRRSRRLELEICKLILSQELELPCGNGKIAVRGEN